MKIINPPFPPPLVSYPERSLTRRAKGGVGGFGELFSKYTKNLQMSNEKRKLKAKDMPNFLGDWRIPL